jgi:uncharacterized protein involved in outer membrane biogenesis
MRMKRLFWALVTLAILAAAFVLTVRAVLASDLVRSALEQQLSGRLGEPVRIGEARAAVVPRIALDLRDVSVGDPPAAELGSVRIVTGLRGLLSRTIVDAEVIVADGRLALPLPFAVFAAAPRLGADEPPAARALTIESITVVAFRNVTVVGGGRELTLDLDSSIDGDRLHVASLTATADDTRIEASGGLTSIERMQGHFDARAALLDIAEMMAVGSALTAPPTGAGPAASTEQPDTLRFVVALTAPAARFSTWDFRDVSMRIEITPGRVTLAPLSTGIAGGTASGRLDIETATPSPGMRLGGRIDAVAIEDLMGRDGAPGGITGRLGGEVSLTASGTDPDALLANARGSIRAALTDGTIPGMDMVRAIVLAFGRPDGAPPEGSGSAFSRLGGTFTLADGVMSSDDFAMESRDFDLSGDVTLNVVTRALDASVDVVLSKALTAQAGTDLRRYAQEDGRVIVPARITGTLDRAIVSLDLAGVAKRAIGTELRRRTRSLLDDLFRRRYPPQP